MMAEIRLAWAIMKTEKGLVWFFPLSSVAFFLLVIFIPVLTTPGDDFFFHLQILGPFFVSVLVSLSILNGFLLTQQAYIWKHGKKRDGIKGGASAGFGSAFSAMLSIFACSACYTPFLAFFGFGFASFVLKYRYLISIMAVVIVVYAIYANAKKINGHCEVCRLD